MLISKDTPLRELAVECRGAIPILERSGIDYYCGGEHSLAEGCRHAQVDVDAIVPLLDSAQAVGADAGRVDWHRHGPLVSLLAHLEERYHHDHRAALSRVYALFEEASQAGADPALPALRPILRALETTTCAHEATACTLFADVMAFEADAMPQSLALPGLARVVHDVRAEHLRVRSLLAASRRITADYCAPPDATPAMQAFFAALTQWEANARTHAHLENNVLLPWAAELDPRMNRSFTPLHLDEGHPPAGSMSRGRGTCRSVEKALP
jgi:regulator of cell morphogenesis and NO signaling